MTPVVSYLRTSSSTNVGDDKDSQARQEIMIERYASRHKMEVIETAYDEGRSGADPVDDRTGFKALLNFCRGHGIKTILLETSSRYARDKDGAVLGFYMLKTFGIESLIDCKDSTDLLGLWFSGKPFEALMPFIKMIMSEDEKREVVRRLRSGRERKKELTGKCEGRRSLTQIHGKEIKVVAERAKSRGKSLREISELLVKSGVTRGNGLPLSTGQISDLIHKTTLK